MPSISAWLGVICYYLIDITSVNCSIIYKLISDIIFIDLLPNAFNLASANICIILHIVESVPWNP